MHKRLISIDITLGNYQSFIVRLCEMAISGISAYVCVSNVHMLIEAYKNKEFANIVNSADVITPDGMPLAKGLKLIYGIQQDRVAGMDLLPDLLKQSEIRNIPVYFYGGTQSMLDTTAVYCKSTFPLLNVTGLYSPPFRKLTSQEELDIIDRINKSRASFVFVALGCPKQETWMHSMRGKINATMIGIGGALPVMIGVQRRAPEWMQKSSLEWLFRLSQEPKRLFRRYFITNSLFIYLLFKEALNKSIRAR